MRWWHPTCCAHTVNWPEVVRYFLQSVEAAAAADGSQQTAALLQRLQGYDGVRAALWQPAPSARTRRCCQCIP